MGESRESGRGQCHSKVNVIPGAGQLQIVLVVLVPVSTEVLDLISPLALEMLRCPSLGNMNMWAGMG